MTRAHQSYDYRRVGSHGVAVASHSAQSWVKAAGQWSTRSTLMHIIPYMLIVLTVVPSCFSGVNNINILTEIINIYCTIFPIYLNCSGNVGYLIRFYSRITCFNYVNFR